MKKSAFLLFLLLISFSLLTSCKDNSKEADTQVSFTSEYEQKLKDKAKSYSEEELQSGEVSLNEFIKIHGTVLQSDSKQMKIKKGDRFILKSGTSNYQIFNEQEKPIKIGDRIIVYGEYYGFLKGTLIEKEE
ncbi:hypothetical protein [Enterococcus songbeiensis]|uniref:hypothetical protein n=1 Tax=Enterococcus songbeiensis TaxID=2559927 RepID=UPI0010F578E7|nr:hypothetical protein [Enterococcus songbeiensis]